MPQYLISVWHDDVIRPRLHHARRAAHRPEGRRGERRAHRHRHVGLRRRARPGVLGHRAPRARRRRLDDRRSVRGDQGADGRLLGRSRPPTSTKRSTWAARPPPPARARSRSDRSRVSGATTSTAVFRREAGRCTATLIRILGDIDLAEDAVAEAFAIAAEQWPVTASRPTPAAGSPPPPATAPSTGSAASRPAPTATLAAHRLRTESRWNPTTAPRSSPTRRPSSTSSPTTSSA